MKKYLIVLLIYLFCADVTGTVRKVDGPVSILDFRKWSSVDFVDDGITVEEYWDMMHVASTLQGVVNREKPRMYMLYVNNLAGVNVDEYWWDMYSRPGEWLSGVKTETYTDVVDLVSLYKDQIKGAVVYDSNVSSTSSIASAVAGVEDLVAVRYDMTPGSMYRRLVLEGPELDVKCWLVNPDGSSKFTGKGTVPETETVSSGSVKIDPYIWFMENYMKRGKCNTEFAAYYIDQEWRKNPLTTLVNHHQLTNHDFFVSKRAFFFDLSPWGDEPATDDPGQRTGLDRETMQKLLLLAYKQNKGKKFCHIGGFPYWANKYTKHAGGIHDDVPTEWQYSHLISSYNAYMDGDAIGLGAYANASFWQHFPLDKEYPQEWVSREDLKKRGYLNEDGTINFDGREFMVFYVGDYDSAAWIAQVSSYIWDDPARGSVPMMWCISPVLAYRAPQAMHYFRKTATANDYFASADNGAGYLKPGMLQEPRKISGLPSGLDAWENHCTRHYRKWGLSVTGFIIDGFERGLDEDGLDCYRSFSPNGIVPQIIPFTFLHKGMPVMQRDFDIVDWDYAKAADVITSRIEDRPIPFHWFRAILKTPEWYKGVMDELHDRGKKYELIDAPTFFELYRIYLEQNPDAAQGKLDYQVP